MEATWCSTEVRIGNKYSYRKPFEINEVTGNTVRFFFCHLYMCKIHIFKHFVYLSFLSTQIFPLFFIQDYSLVFWWL